MDAKQATAMLGEKQRLPCGLNLENRIVKSAMAECMASHWVGLPNELLFDLYRRWSISGYGLVITGNVQVDKHYLGLPFDVHISNANCECSAWTEWAAACSPIPTIVQLNHPGRQSLRGNGRWFWQPSIAPSSIPLGSGPSLLSKVLTRIIFGCPRAATREDLELIVLQFTKAAIIMQKAGFAGVQIHCSHGYLLAQMMSPATNKRTDEYGNSPEARLKLLFDIIDSIRTAVPSSFCVGVKVNAADYVEGGLTEDDALYQMQLLVKHGGVDLIEISGGSYDAPSFTAENKRGSKREAFFAVFSRRSKTYLESLDLATKSEHPLIMLTGGFRTRIGMATAVEEEAADLVGIARPACVDENFALKMLDSTVDNDNAQVPVYNVRGVEWMQSLVPVKIVGAGFSTGQ